MGKPTLSVVIIAKNAEEKIGNCLKLLSWADEVLVVDNASTDKTYEIAKSTGVKVVEASDKFTLDYAGLRNIGLKEAAGDWILYVDADERVTPGLQQEVLEVSKSEIQMSNGYAVPRRNFIFGKEFKHGGQSPDFQKRLFKKSALKGWSGKLHEQPEFSGKLGHLKNPFVHLKEDNLSDMVEKTNAWSEIEAREMFDTGHPPMNIFRFFTAGFREFWKRFILELAFLDGTEGIIYGMYQVYSRLISYAKLWELQLKNQK